MLDKLSKRILKFMCTADDPSNAYYDFGEDLFRIADAVSSDAETVRAAVGHLQDQGFISCLLVTVLANIILKLL